MTRLRRGISARQFIEALHEDGFQLQRSRGSHRVYRHRDGRRIVVAFHSLSATFPIGTLKGMIQDVGWSEQDLKRLGLAG